MLFIRANTHFNIHTLSIQYHHLPICISTCPSMHTGPSGLLSMLMHKQPPSHHSGIPVLCALLEWPCWALPSSSPLAACCTSPNVAFLSIFALSPAEQACTTFVPSARACSPSYHVCPQISFLGQPLELLTCSAHHLWTAFHLTGPGAPLFLSPPISWPLCHFLSFHHPSANSFHICPPFCHLRL